MRIKWIISVIIVVVFIVGLFLVVRISKVFERGTEAPSDLEAVTSIREVIGKSVEGRNIEAYTYGSGLKHLVFVGGVHGGYEWNSVLLAYRFMDYLEMNSGGVPSSLTVTVIPSANPDGVYKVIGKDGRFEVEDVPVNVSLESGRFNARGVDLNRNFACKWQPESTWKGNVVSAGSKAFSEPEAVAIRDFALKNKPEAFIFWHSQSNAVYASECENGILFETLEIMKAYSLASGYSAIDSFDAYEITGDAEGWLASIDIPTITVELKTHEAIEWEKNLKGVLALFEYYR